MTFAIIFDLLLKKKPIAPIFPIIKHKQCYERFLGFK